MRFEDIADNTTLTNEQYEEIFLSNKREYGFSLYKKHVSGGFFQVTAINTIKYQQIEGGFRRGQLVAKNHQVRKTFFIYEQE